MSDHPGLVIALEAAVPLEIHRMRRLPPSLRALRAEGAVDSIASKGDMLMFRGSPGETAEVFGHLMRGLAFLACAPGGVTFAGVHWCAFSHPYCPRPGPRPKCCACEPDCAGCEDCPWCRNGCAAASGRQCCTEEWAGGTP